MSRVLVCGGRDFTNIAFIWSNLDRLHAEYGFTAMITGGARGVDTIANDWGKTKPIKRYVSKAKWTEHGKAAGPIRNARMLEWGPDLVVAFMPMSGPGTANMIAQSERAGVKIIKVGDDCERSCS